MLIDLEYIPKDIQEKVINKYEVPDKGRNKMFNIISEIDCSIIIFESPKRIYKTLNNIYDYLGNRFITICKEMTKIHESYYFGFIKDIIDVPDKSFEKGEIVIIISKNNYKP